MPSVLAVCVVSELRADSGSVGVTAIDKRPVVTPVRVGAYGLYADVQADRKHHGGLDQAVYAYGQEDADWWAEQVGAPFPAGTFGENLRIEGFDVNASRVGDRWCIGEQVVLEVTSPREPCQTFARWIESQGIAASSGWVKRFAAARRPGPYLRVVRVGTIVAGDPVEVVPAPAGARALLEDYLA